MILQILTDILIIFIVALFGAALTSSEAEHILGGAWRAFRS